MEEGQSLGSVLDPSTDGSRSGLKTTREKRSITDSGGESPELSRKRIKMRDLEAVFRSEGLEIHSSVSVGSEPVKNQLHFVMNKEVSEITTDPKAITSDVIQTETTGQNTVSHPQSASCLSSHWIDSDINARDLNTKAHLAIDSACDVGDECKASTKDKNLDPNFVASGIALDLNANDTPNSAGPNPFYPYKRPGYVKSSEASECGSSTGPLEESDSYRRWKEMKRNGFLSSAHGGIPMPAQPQPQRGKKRKNDTLKKRMEIAKREQVHRFTKIAAPSGLLNGLNPGIINHVRNSKQVHSIIEALVRSNKLENSNQSRLAVHVKGGMDTNEKGKNEENIHHTGPPRSGVYFKDEHTNTSTGNMQTKDNPMSSSIPNMSLISEHKGGCGNSEVAERRFYDETSGASHLTSNCEDEMLILKLSSSITTTSGNEESTNHSSVSSLSAKAATVASQWLELLYQDIRGRLAALRRSKKRVQAVIQTELPFLILKEFSPSLENDPYIAQSPSKRGSNTAVLDVHRARWTALFDQMDKALTEEGKHLESWLNQVKEMQLQCQRGLQYVNLHSLQSLGRPEIDSRPRMEFAERDLAVRAAAASIYSTCNFVKTTEDVSCF